MSTLLHAVTVKIGREQKGARGGVVNSNGATHSLRTLHMPCLQLALFLSCIDHTTTYTDVHMECEYGAHLVSYLRGDSHILFNSTMLYFC